MLEVDVDKLVASPQVHQLLNCLHVVALTVEDTQMFQEADVKELVQLVERDVELLQLLECLDALHFFQLAAGDVQDAHVAERSADVAEAPDD